MLSAILLASLGLMPSGNGITELLRVIRNPLTAMQTTSPTMTARMFRRSGGIKMQLGRSRGSLLSPHATQSGSVACGAGSGMRGRSCAGSNMRTAAESLRSSARFIAKTQRALLHVTRQRNWQIARAVIKARRHTSECGSARQSPPP